MNKMNSQSIIDIQGILKLLPHRYPFLLVDRIIEVKENEYAIGIKNVTFNEPQFTGHFPESPIMPGVLIIEAMAQVGAVLMAHSLKLANSPKLKVYFMSIDQTKFRKMVTPGDTLRIKASILQHRGNVWKMQAKAYIEEEIAAESVFTAMVKTEE